MAWVYTCLMLGAARTCPADAYTGYARVCSVHTSAKGENHMHYSTNSLARTKKRGQTPSSGVLSDGIMISSHVHDSRKHSECIDDPHDVHEIFYFVCVARTLVVRLL